MTTGCRSRATVGEAGLPVGDQLLRAVTTRLAVTMRESDSVGRLGGDEFVFVVDDADEAQQRAIELGARLLDASPEHDTFRVYADPAGHPFCLCTG